MTKSQYPMTKKDTSFILIYITNPTRAEAKKIARHLLRKKLIGCANIFRIDSLYWWEGKIADDGEYILIVETMMDKFEKVKKEVESIHSYSTPCIIRIPVTSNEKYFNWLRGEVV